MQLLHMLQLFVQVVTLIAPEYGGLALQLVESLGAVSVGLNAALCSE